MKISIIVPIYNAEKYLKRCIDSILNQSYRDIELILVNDGSKDNSLDICRNYEVYDKRVIVLDTINSGPGVARNIGITKASGDYISFVDADDWVCRDAFEILIKNMSKEDYDIVSCNYFRVNLETKVSKNNYKTGEISRDGTREQIKNYHLFKTTSSFGYVWGKIYKSSLIKQNNIEFSCNRKVFLEDTLFNLKAFSYNPKYYVLNKPLYYYNIYEDSISNKKEDVTDRAIKMLEDYEKFLEKRNIYDENLDLFVPLATRTMSWSLFKSMEKDKKLKLIYMKVLEFSKNKTINRLFFKHNSLKELRKIEGVPQILLYSFIVLCIRYKLEKLLALTFYINYPLFKRYIKGSLKM